MGSCHAVESDFFFWKNRLRPVLMRRYPAARVINLFAGLPLFLDPKAVFQYIHVSSIV